MASQIQIRRDLALNWTTTDPILANGEFGYETDTGRIKIGDGTTVWTALVYKFEKVFGDSFQNSDSNGISTEGAGTYTIKTSIVTTSLPLGNYIILLSCEVKNDTVGGVVQVRTQINSTTMSAPKVTPNNTTDWNSFNSFRVRNMSGIQTINMEFRRQTSGIASIRKARLAIWRVS